MLSVSNVHDKNAPDFYEFLERVIGHALSRPTAVNANAKSNQIEKKDKDLKSEAKTYKDLKFCPRGFTRKGLSWRTTTLRNSEDIDVLIGLENRNINNLHSFSLHLYY